MNAFAFGAAAIGAGFVVWFGLIVAGFGFMKLVGYLNDKASDRQAFWGTVLTLALVICYMTGATILQAAGAT
jgi:uncharacterized membrane protein YidH (DUF202 family)